MKLTSTKAGYFQPKPGPIVEEETGKTLEMHQGIWNFTIGQGARIKGMSQRMCVSRKDPVKNIIYVVPGT